MPRIKGNDKIERLQRQLSSWIEFLENNLEEAIEKGMPPNLIAIAFFDLALGKLAANEIDTAKGLFFQGTNSLIENKEIKSNISFIDYYAERKYAIYAYLGGNRELARPLAIRLISEFNLRRARIPTPYLSPPEKNFENLYLIMDNLILDKSNEVKILIDNLDKKLSKFKISGSLYNKSGLYNKYSFFGKEMVKALFIKDEEQFSKNADHWSNLALNVLSLHDTSKALVSPELILLHDLALDNGLRPKIVSPFIPKTILDHGYWNQQRYSQFAFDVLFRCRFLLRSRW